MVNGGSGIGPSGSFRLSWTEPFFIWLPKIEDKIGLRMIPCRKSTGMVDGVALIFDVALTNIHFFFFSNIINLFIIESQCISADTGSGMGIVRGIVAIGFPDC